jgi:hypothetical protein
VVSGDAGGDAVVHGVRGDRTTVLPLILLTEFRSLILSIVDCRLSIAIAKTWLFS